MRTTSRILGFSVGAVMLSTVVLAGTAHAAEVAPSSGGSVSTQVTCDGGGNLNWDGTPQCAAAQTG